MTETDDLVRIERPDGGVAVLTLANGKVNSLSTAVLGRLRAHLDELRDDPPGALVVTGGPRIFAAGADIDEFAGPDEARAVATSFGDALDALAAFPRATVAAVNGYALGGGCELAMACDLRVAAANATFGQPEILLGIIPGGGGTQRLARLVGPARAKDIILRGRQVRAEEALRIGLADEVVAPDEVLPRALDLAAELARGPLAVQALAKRAIDDGLDRSLADGLALERDLFVESFRTEDAAIGVASFRAHGPGRAEFVGR